MGTQVFTSQGLNSIGVIKFVLLAVLLILFLLAKLTDPGLLVILVGMILCL